MKQNTKMIAIVLSLLLIAGISGMAIAYFAAHDNKINTLTPGDNEAEVDETFVKPEELKTEDNKFLKEVKVKNTGDIDCYVRVYIGFTSSDVMNNTGFAQKINDTDTKDTATYYPANPEHTPNTAGNADDMAKQESFRQYLTEESNSNWVYGDDGYYYYKKIVKANTATSALFDWVNTRFSGDAEIVAYDLIIYSETIQAYDANGNPIPETDNGYLTAWGKTNTTSP